MQHGDVNVAKFIASKSDPELRRCIAESDVVCADGMGIVFACRLLAIPVPERVTGIDLMMAIIEVCAREGFRPYFLGARQDVLDKAMHEVLCRHPQLKIAGWRNGYFAPQDEAKIVAEIRATGADCVFVGISSPIKEAFLNRHRNALGAPVQLGVGGAFDVLAGHVSRAPRWMQRIGLEWLFRLIQEPRRLTARYLTTNTRFLFLVVAAAARKCIPVGLSQWVSR